MTELEYKTIPLTIITGFLGAGKTTLLNSIITTYTNTGAKKFAVIENEFGEVNIDSGLVVGAKENIYELSNGCICCTINDDFRNVLEKLIDSGYEFNHLLVETTGIAEPLSVLAPFLTDGAIQQIFKVDSVLCVVDALNVLELIDDQIEVRQQIALSDTILVNKCDAVGEKTLEEVLAKIKSLNETVHIYTTSFGKVEGMELLDTNAYDGAAIQESVLAYNPGECSIDCSNPDHHHHHHYDHDHDHDSHSDHNEDLMHTSPEDLAKKILSKHDITSAGFTIKTPFNLEMFSAWLQNYLYYKRNSLLRVKGILAFRDMDERYIFHSVRGSYLFEVGEPWGGEKPFSKIVFIGKGINKSELGEILLQLTKE